ncbi:hypothetical protein D3C84_857500 [compost metagenome]
MPCAQPLMNSRTNMIVTLDVAQWAKPNVNITAAETTRPNGRKKRGLERSDTMPIRNLDKP